MRKIIALGTIVFCIAVAPKVEAQFQYLLASSEVGKLSRQVDERMKKLEARVHELEKQLAALEKKK